MSAFLKKEWTESVRSKKLFLFIIVSVFIGILNPFTAKITPFLFENFLPASLNVGEIEVTALDSWIQFYKNVPQFGLIFFLLLFSNQMAREYDLNALTLLLTKGLKRSHVLISKFIMAHLFLAAGLLIMFIVTYLYTAFYWNQAMIKAYFLPLFSLFIFASFLYTFNLLGQVYFKSVISGIILTLLVVFSTYLLSFFFEALYNPLYLILHSLDFVQGHLNLGDALPALLVTLALIVSFFFLTIKVFNRQAI